MKLLLLRLSALDADAENALRVISFFDELIARRVPLRTLLAETAKLAECPVGVYESGLGISLRAEPRGRVGVEDCAAAEPVRRELTPDSGVWLERSGQPFALDDIVLERFAIAAALLLDHERGPVSDVSDEGPVKLALSADASEALRSRALRAMGFEPGEPMCTLAVTGPAPQTDVVVALALPRAGARFAVLGSIHAVLTRLPEPGVLDAVPAGFRVGVGPELPGLEAPYSWQQARVARKFSSRNGRGPQVVRATELGAMAIIAEKLRNEDIAQVPDVAVLDELAAEPNGSDTIAILDALCRTGSIRKAANEVFRHHTTLISKLTHAESRLGFSLSTPAGRMRAELALSLRQLAIEPD